jgi:hypothetical protein
MQTFINMAAQGDFVIFKVNKIPDNVEVVTPEKGNFIIAHSETGHNHVMEAEKVKAFKPAKVADVDLYELFLEVKEPTKIEHLRSYDTHESLLVPAGTWQIKRQREYTAEGFRRAQD